MRHIASDPVQHDSLGSTVFDSKERTHRFHNLTRIAASLAALFSVASTCIGCKPHSSNAPGEESQPSIARTLKSFTDIDRLTSNETAKIVIGSPNDLTTSFHFSNNIFVNGNKLLQAVPVQEIRRGTVSITPSGRMSGSGVATEETHNFKEYYFVGVNENEIGVLRTQVDFDLKKARSFSVTVMKEPDSVVIDSSRDRMRFGRAPLYVYRGANVGEK